MNANLKLARQFAWATLITILLGLVVGFVGERIIGLEPDTGHRLQIIPRAFQPMALILAFAGLLILVTACVFVAGVSQGVWRRFNHGQKAEPDAAPNGGPAKPSGNSGANEGPPSER